MFDIITIGDAVIDTHVDIDNASTKCDVNSKTCRLLLDYASKIPITGTFQALGGNAANVACAMEKLGLNSAILTTIGTDANGQMVVSELKKNKVDTSLIKKSNQTKTRYSIVLNFQGERTILSYHENRDYFWPKKFPASSWIYYTSMSAGFQSLQKNLLEHLKAHPTIKVAFNPGSYQLKSCMTDIKEILPFVQLLTINLEEAELIAGTSYKKAKSIEPIFNKLLNLGVREVIITDAERGAYAGDEDELWHMPIYPTKVVSKTGAGDSFSSGYLAARINNHDIHTALCWGTALSGSVVANPGPQSGLLNTNEIIKIIEKYPKIKPKRMV